MNTLEIKKVLHAICLEEGRLDPPLGKREISFLVDTLLDTLATAVISTGKVTLRDFGTLKRVTRKGRSFKVVKKDVTVPDRETIVFKPGVGFKKMLEESCTE